MQNNRILVVDDEINILKTIELSLISQSYSPEVFSNPIDAVKRTKEVFFEVAFVDLKMQPLDGISTLVEIKKNSPETTIVLMTAHGSIESAVEAIKKGAYDYISKPFTHKEFLHIVEKAFEHHMLAKRARGLAEQLEHSFTDENFITVNPLTKQVLLTAKEVANSDIPVLIEGESGTGKELLAKFIHNNSNRSGNPFIAINCSAIPENLFESELFGHVKGAFTTAIKDRLGRLDLADGGTLFLDEVADIPKQMQVKLLRFLQNMEFERVGESITRKVDVRIISATNRKIESDLASGVLREDFYYRIVGVRLRVPPLRVRKDDIDALLQNFVSRYGSGRSITIAEDSKKLLLEYDWPGNVREFETTVKRMLVFAKNNVVFPEHLPQEINVFKPKAITQVVQKIDELERQHILDVLKMSPTTKEAAKILGISETTLWRKRKLYGL
ncbi:MAG: two component sigma54 specific transcriptional regulator Fis family [Ignavibacteria bacterium]|nr:MAG: two component sigma54 specific transcriptional regulator Fis family [Ignavibacteria bacterium]KAF0159008.1 MAG: two component sigma54 specific transcriptional regulator Fis family [Ignavibacteria bacterium]